MTATASPILMEMQYSWNDFLNFSSLETFLYNEFLSSNAAMLHGALHAKQ
jgi:hypothetical protein